ncbi:MAG: P-loop NTPase fold protein [Bacteroidota bacterium]
MNSYILNDDSITDIAQDKLHFKPLAETLAEIVEHSKPPLTIGIYGEWGAGKTSLMRMSKSVLEQKQHYKIIWFDAWKFDKTDNLKTALISVILKAIEKDATAEAAIKHKAKKLFKDVNWVGLGVKTLQFVSPFVNPLLAAAIPALQELIPKNKDGEADIKEIKHDLKSFHNSESEKRIELIEEFHKNYKELVDDYLGEQGRMVIYIDDLDRCMPDKALDIFEVIKLFLNVDKSIFIIGMNKKVIANGIEQKYGANSSKWSSDYLDKVIQIPFRLPPIERNIIEDDFISKLNVSPGVKNSIEIIADSVDNPRTIKRLLNNYEIYRILSKKRGIKIEEMILAKIIVLEFRWRRFFNKYLEFRRTQNFNAIDHLYKYIETKASEGEISNQNLKEFYQDNSLLSFLRREPTLKGVNLDDYLYFYNRSNLEIEEENNFDIAFKAYEDRNYDQAISFYTKELMTNPKNKYAYFNRGLAFKNINDSIRAIENFTNVIRLDEDYERIYFERGYSYYKMKKYDKAISDFKMQLKKSPSDHYSFEYLGKCFYDRKDYKEAIEQFNLAIQHNPTDDNEVFNEVYNNRGMCKYNLRQADYGIEDYTYCINMNTSEGYVYLFNRSLIYYYITKELEKASDDLISSIELDDSYTRSYDNLLMLVDTLLEKEEKSKKKKRVNDLKAKINRSKIAKETKDKILSYIEMNRKS